jgi:hypothetical protein
LARFKVPRYIEFVSRLPKTATAKIEKHVLRTGNYPRGQRIDVGESVTRLANQRIAAATEPESDRIIKETP